MDGKGVKKLPNGVEKFGVLDHFSADLDGICLGITGVNDPSDSVQMPIGCRNWHNVLSFAAGKTSTAPFGLIVHRDARFL